MVASTGSTAASRAPAPTGPPGQPRLLLVHPNADLYGSDRMALTALAAAQDAGWQTLVAVAQEGLFTEELGRQGARFRRVETPVLRKVLLSPAGLVSLARSAATGLPAAVRLCRDFAPDVMLVNTVTVPSWLAVARLTRTPVACYVHEAELEVGRARHAALTKPLRMADVAICISEAARRFVVDGDPRLADRCRIVYNGVELPAEGAPWSRLPDRQRHRLLVVGRLSPRKGQDVAVRALAALVAAGHDVQLDLVGDCYPGYEWFEADLRTLARDLGVADRVHLPGFVSDAAQRYADAGVVVVPSLVEPFGLVAVEGMAARRPVVASDVQGLAEIVRDGATGLLVPPGDPKALADAVARVLTDPAGAERLSAAGSRDARERFNQRRYAADLISVLDDVRRTARGRRPARAA